MPMVKQTDQFKYAITEGNKIPLSGIKVSSFVSEFTDIQFETINKYNCKQRAESANSRALGIITALHVAECLISNSFKCYYCNINLNADWHLDHYFPISKGGTNRFLNLVPSCNICNIMKGSLTAIDFYNQCKYVYENLLIKEDRNSIKNERGN